MSTQFQEPEQTTQGDGICVLHNPRSGKQEADATSEDLSTAFARHGLSPDIVELNPDVSLTETVRKVADKGYGTIVAAGGDGTICGVTEALKDTKCRLGILPRGTFNYFARSLDIPQELDGAVEVIAKGHARPLRIATLNDRVFLNNANFGLYPHILRSREEIYDYWGRSRAAAYWSALKVLFRWPRPLKIEISNDGQSTVLRTPLIFVFNNAFQLREMGMEGANCIEDGKLALMIAPDCGRLGMIRSSLAVLTGQASRKRDFDIICSDSFELRARRGKRLLVARDGERTHMDGPFRLQLADTPLEVLVPHKFTETVR
ncbi:diacylglycerol/lipid kinase family protein [Marinibacterium profundimaris]|uniref:diacylglycerol/lipid kinase family protein n=1 Tax=Marinibacterium profundimaris TaxID=1679460 RepID=UPI000B523E3B|nr:diacylglycerol kinase family protein [Marinibacterium profundimaris]